MRASQLQKALESLAKAIRDVDAALLEMRADPDPLALHIFLSRREYRHIDDPQQNTGSIKKERHAALTVTLASLDSAAVLANGSALWAQPPGGRDIGFSETQGNRSLCSPIHLPNRVICRD